MTKCRVGRAFDCQQHGFSKGGICFGTLFRKLTTKNAKKRRRNDLPDFVWCAFTKDVDNVNKPFLTRIINEQVHTKTK